MSFKFFIVKIWFTDSKLLELSCFSVLIGAFALHLALAEGSKIELDVRNSSKTTHYIAEERMQ